MIDSNATPLFSMDDPAFVENILKARARRLAASRDQLAQVQVGETMLCFRVGGERYALALDSLVEVATLGAVTPVPGQPRELLGVTNLRGEIRPVLNLHQMLGLAEPAEDVRAFAVYLRGPSRAVGLRVDEMRRIRTIDPQTLTYPAQSGNGLPQRFIRGISPDTLIILDPTQILAQDVLRDRRADYRIRQ